MVILKYRASERLSLWTKRDQAGDKCKTHVSESTNAGSHDQQVDLLFQVGFDYLDSLEED